MSSLPSLCAICCIACDHPSFPSHQATFNSIPDGPNLTERRLAWSSSGSRDATHLDPPRGAPEESRRRPRPRVRYERVREKVLVRIIEVDIQFAEGEALVQLENAKEHLGGERRRL